MSRSLAIGSALIAVLYLYSLFGASDRFTMTPFRESQTAITAHYMATEESPFLAYHVPVKGEPWALPMEFPFFQWITAQVGGTDSDALRWAGRLLSLASWLGCLGFAYLLARRAPVHAADRRWFIVLLTAAPIYVAYSVSFLIETFVLMFALGYLWAFLRGRESRPWSFTALAIGFGVLASLGKPTTWAPFAGVIILALFIDVFGHFRAKKPLAKLLPILGQSGLLVGIPLVAGLVWVHFGDAVKMEAPLTRELTSERLSVWNYGSLAQKMSPAVWAVIFGKQWILLLGMGACLLPVVGILAFRRSLQAIKHAQWLRPLWCLLTFAGYLSAPIVFTNLHFRHDYYMLANGFFLIAFFVLCLSSLRSSGNSTRWISMVYGLTLASMLVAGGGYLALKKSFAEPQEEALIAALKELPEGPVVFSGFGWSSKMPYELERRALMLSFDSAEAPQYEEVVGLNRKLPWVAIAIANESLDGFARNLSEDLGGGFDHEVEVWPGLKVMSRVPFPDETGAMERPPLLQKVDTKLLDSEAGERGVIYLHTPLTPKDSGNGLFELMLRRGEDLFYIDSESLRFYRLRGMFRE